MNLSDDTKKLEDLFTILNDQFFENGLPLPVITVMTHGHRNCTGWCSTEPLWKNKDDDESNYFEMNICSEYLAGSTESIVAMLLHEMVHLLNIKDGIQDSSRSGLYHNRRFKESAERHGLLVEKVPGAGYAKTVLNSEARQFASTLKGFQLNLFRDTKVSEKKKKRSSIRLTCPVCGGIARVTNPAQKLICGSCHVTMK